MTWVGAGFSDPARDWGSAQQDGVRPSGGGERERRSHDRRDERDPSHASSRVPPPLPPHERDDGEHERDRAEDERDPRQRRGAAAAERRHFASTTGAGVSETPGPFQSTTVPSE